MQNMGKAKRSSIGEADTSKPAKESKTAVLNVRIKPSVKAMIERLADADGRSLANYIERLIEAAGEAAQGSTRSSL
jgi:predicted HicB family RNase H-like nuclease